MGLDLEKISGAQKRVGPEQISGARFMKSFMLCFKGLMEI